MKKLDSGKMDYPDVATYSGKIVNRPIEAGEQIFRVFGPGVDAKTAVHGEAVKRSFASGRPGGNSFWGLNEVPPNAETWRKTAAVLDEWNHNGFIVIGTVLPGHSLPACTGLIAEQKGAKIGAQYLEGGGKQAMVKLPEDVAQKLGEAAERAERTGREVVEAGGIRWELRATGWSDVNGVHGYTHPPGPGSTQTERLPTGAVASKVDKK